MIPPFRLGSYVERVYQTGQPDPMSKTRHSPAALSFRPGVWSLGLWARPEIWSSLLLAGMLVLVGCQTPTRSSGKAHDLLARHPVNETRMSSEPRDGLVPTGVWRIRGPRCTLYLAGTCHVITSDQVPFPSSFYAAYQDSKEVYLEDVGGFSFPQQVRMIFKLFKWMKSHQAEMLCPKGRSVEDFVSADTAQRLRSFYGRKYPQRQRMTPLMLAFFEQVDSVAQQYERNAGVEDVFSALAKKDRKPIRALDDRSADQLVFLVLDEMLLELSLEINKRGADAVLVEKVLGDKTEIRETDWRTGNLTDVLKEIEQLKQDAPVLHQRLASDRNHKWMDRIILALQSNQNVIVLVGVAHLGGSEGLLALLEAQGYRVEQLYGVDPLLRAKSPS